MRMPSRLARVGRPGARTRSGLLAAASLSAACGSGSGTNPPNLASTFVDANVDANVAVRDASATTVDATTEMGGLQDGAAPSSDASTSAQADSTTDDVSPPAAVCREGVTWSTAARVAGIDASGFDRFGAISASELTVAWTTSAGVIYVADRTSNTMPFAPPGVVDPGMTQLAIGRVALTPDGLEVIATLADGSSFTAFDRVSLGQTTWLPSTSEEFKIIAATISESGGAFAEPVVSADGQSLFYLLTIGDADAGALPVLYESPWDATTHTWQYGQPVTSVAGTDFLSQSGAGLQVRRPTGASSDRLTLFFFDEIQGHERGAWRDSPGAAFDTFEDLPNLPEVAPGGDCFYVYFYGTDDAGQGLFSGMGL